METIPNEIWKGADFWKSQIDNWIASNDLNKLPFYNDVVGEKRAPHPDSGYGDPLITDALLDDELCDIYHSDHAGGTWHRVFIHHKGSPENLENTEN